MPKPFGYLPSAQRKSVFMKVYAFVLIKLTENTETPLLQPKTITWIKYFISCVCSLDLKKFNLKKTVYVTVLGKVIYFIKLYQFCFFFIFDSVTVAFNFTFTFNCF